MIAPSDMHERDLNWPGNCRIVVSCFQNASNLCQFLLRLSAFTALVCPAAACMYAIMPKQCGLPVSTVQAKELQQGLYQMPGTSGEVPAIFMDMTGGPEDSEVAAGDAAGQELVYDGDAIVLD